MSPSILCGWQDAEKVRQRRYRIALNGRKR